VAIKMTSSYAFQHKLKLTSICNNHIVYLTLN